MQKDCTTENGNCQVSAILQKAYSKKANNKPIIDWLKKVGEVRRAHNVENCATHIGVTEIEGVAKIVKADFCRERICNICAWRRQSKFVAQMIPALKILSGKYKFIFATLTIKNVGYGHLKECVSEILSAYDRLLKRRQIKREWVGKVRALELTYNSESKTFHPHLHLLVAVRPSYFKSDGYITTDMLEGLWGESLGVDYTPVCDIRAVADDEKGAVETIKYTLKPSKDEEAIKGFFYALKGRRLVSFSGVFAEVRRELRQSDFEKILIDDIDLPERTRLTYKLYKFDATGGVYSFFKEMEMETK